LGFVILKVIHRYKIVGRENTPPGACIVCANHTSYSDAIFVAAAMDTKVRMRFMGKAELFKIRPIAAFLKKLGAFPVARGEADVGALKNSLRVLKDGERLILFPEGTRNYQGDAKAGAGMLAARSKSPILPVYIPPRKRVFRKVTVIVGKPYTVEPDGKPTNEDYRRIAAEIMEKIAALAPGSTR
jgi:1-acyl-sn-glycerol-3-phosphate acyltransferase